MSSAEGARRAIGAGIAATRRADERRAEGVRRFDACRSVAEVRAVLDWMRGQDFFFASAEASEAMLEAFERARQRVTD